MQLGYVFLSSWRVWISSYVDGGVFCISALCSWTMWISRLTSGTFCISPLCSWEFRGKQNLPTTVHICVQKWGEGQRGNFFFFFRWCSIWILIPNLHSPITYWLLQSTANPKDWNTCPFFKSRVSILILNFPSMLYGNSSRTNISKSAFQISLY